MQDLSEERQENPQLDSPENGEAGLAHSGINAVEESPELLRWRADILLDEMMLGAVDVAAGRPTRATNASLIDESATESPLPERPSGDASLSKAPTATSAVAGRSASPMDTANFTPATSQSTVKPGDSPRPGSASIAVSAQSASPAVAPSSSSEQSVLRPPTASLVAAGEVATPVGGRIEAAANTWQSDLTASSAFDDQDRRSTLLPRESKVDVRSRLREIDQLETDLELALPSEHEWSVRSHHLLAKAANILQQHPERSAEVDYYLQQVRSILERAQQSDAYSKLYIKRLTIYLASWTLLSVVGLLGSLLYAEEIALAVASWFDLPADGILASHLLAFLLTLFAATLGASIGALRIMARYRKLGRGYIDRKYSLRYLLLPLLALLFGLLVYLLFGLIAVFSDVDPLQAPLLALIPAVIAFLFGLVQEYFYGTAT